ncbi:MAG: ATP-grasp domain-containing protein [Spirochaetia bacterium]
MGKSVLILGGGTMQLPAIRNALSRQWTVSVADGNPEAPGADLCHHFIHVDLRDTEQLIEAAGDLKKKRGLDGVFTAGTDFSYTVAKIAEVLDLPGMPPETARGASDKVLMRRIFAEKGVPAPSFVQVTPGENVREEVRELSFPLVVKPVDNMGSRGVRRIDACLELEEAAEKARSSSFSGNIIVEEFIEGAEFSIDALIEDGEVSITGFADRIIRFSPYFVEMGHTLPSEIEPSLQETIEGTFRDAVKALGITEGAAKGDVKWNGREAVVGEVAARLSGGYMSGWTYPYATGVDLTGAALNISVGLPAGDLTPKFREVSAERAFISIPGTVASLEEHEEVREMPGVEELFIRVARGDTVRFPTNNVEKCGNVIAVDKNREEACKTAEKAVQRVWVRLEPEEGRTERFLYRREEGWIEDAFIINVPENYRYYIEMRPLDIVHDSSVSRGAKGGGAEKAPPEVLIYPLPLLYSENTVDWHGASLADTVERALSFTGARIVEKGSYEEASRAESPQERVPHAGTVILGSVFWTALLTGGLQGGVWSIETIQRILGRGEDPRMWWKKVGAANLNKDLPDKGQE